MAWIVLKQIGLRRKEIQALKERERKDKTQAHTQTHLLFGTCAVNWHSQTHKKIRKLEKVWACGGFI